MAICHPDMLRQSVRAWPCFRWMARHGQTGKPQTLWVHMLRLTPCLRSFCSAPNIITLQGHVVYSSMCLVIRYEDSLSIWVYMCVWMGGWGGHGGRGRATKECDCICKLHMLPANLHLWNFPSLDCSDEHRVCCRLFGSYKHRMVLLQMVPAYDRNAQL